MPVAVVLAALAVPVMLQAGAAVPAEAAVALALAPQAVLGLAVEVPAQMPERRAMLTASPPRPSVAIF
jgi:hypothetical protein